MSDLSVTMVTAFGRGETLAIALAKRGLNVHVIDFTEAFGPEWQRGAGPFPWISQAESPAQASLVGELKELPRGLTFWLPRGPLELSGPMSAHFAKHSPAVGALGTNRVGATFDENWIRRYLSSLGSAYATESWEADPRAGKLPDAPFALLPHAHENRLLSFERYRTLENAWTAGQKITSAQNEAGSLVSVQVDGVNLRSAQWIWCLSSEETERLGVEASRVIFPRGVVPAEWRWLSIPLRTVHGPWSDGIPAYAIVIGDLHLPWTYSNHILLRRLEPDSYLAWMRVPADAAFNEARVRDWATEAETLLRSRLELAEWRFEPARAAVCPHSPVFAYEAGEEKPTQWKNWEWIAPETLGAVDWSARLEREALVLARFDGWKNDQMKKGARGDHALHAP